MHLRELPTRTLADVAVAWKHHDREWTSDACVPRADYARAPQQEPILILGDHEITLDEQASARLCAFYQIPTAYFRRITPAEQHFVMNARMDHAEGEITITYNDLGITDVRKPTKPRVEADEFVRIAHRILPASATVLDAWVTADELRLDVINHDVEDGIRGGLRFGQNRKQNLAPTVAPLLFHEDTTTVIEIPDPSLKIDARGISVDKIAERLAAEALRAAARLHSDAQHLLRLANISIAGDRITRLHRVAAEHGLPVRPLSDITIALSRSDEPTMLDLALAIGNAANSPKLTLDSTKRAVRIRLQTTAGALVVDEAERCASCHALVAA
ncbi:hypothetical protein [Streptomyces sp. MH60]|uniref:hypothetical protein n=1 Tax=Streptomyces sp. MH60 TaxID=1940758 RepID=UPI000CEEE999|nr:hypothetical protein [Streptomyces sp. MH60]PPS89535.1 hypothetical protein BZZ08_01682 [Streptomyces sp. MH60]